MSDLQRFVRMLSGRRPDEVVSCDDFRFEFDLLQVPESARGGLFSEACHKNYLVPTGLTIKTRHRAGKGRLIRTYWVTDKARQEKSMSAGIITLSDPDPHGTIEAETKTAPAGNGGLSDESLVRSDRA